MLRVNGVKANVTDIIFFVTSATPIQPLPMDILDSLSVHSKMSLIHSIVTHILKQVNVNQIHIVMNESNSDKFSRRNHSFTNLLLGTFGGTSKFTIVCWDNRSLVEGMFHVHNSLFVLSAHRHFLMIA